MTPKPYRVVGCPGCGTVRVVREGPATAQCPRCGRRFRLGSALTYCESKTMEGARVAAACVRSGGTYAPSEGGGWSGTASSLERWVMIARELSADGEGFTEEQFVKAAQRGDGEKALAALLEMGEVLEKRPGLYLAVRDCSKG